MKNDYENGSWPSTKEIPGDPTATVASVPNTL